MPGKYLTPLCRNCHLFIECQTHLLCSCVWVEEAWSFVRQTIARLDPILTIYTDHDILHMNFSQSVRENAVMWIIGHYLEYADYELISQGQKLKRDSLLGLLRAKHLECKNKAMPTIGLIPGVTPTGIG